MSPVLPTHGLHSDEWGWTHGPLITMATIHSRYNHNYHNIYTDSQPGHNNHTHHQPVTSRQVKFRQVQPSDCPQQPQIVNVRYENEKRSSSHSHKNSLSRRYSMIEDPDYQYTNSKSNKNFSSFNSNKPAMQTSRLSVFLQQNKEPTTYTKPASYGFSTGYSHDSPNIRRTRNDDEYYTGFTRHNRSSSSRRSGLVLQWIFLKSLVASLYYKRFNI